MPKVSVIVASYNLEKYVGRTIQSVIDQTFIDWELIIIDDGSNDNSCMVINKYAQLDNRIKPFLLEKNVGVCTVYNYGIELSKGDYIAILDSDDFWEPEKLDIQMNYMINNPNCGVCFTWAKVVDENEKEVPDNLCENRGSIFKSDNRTQAQWLRTFFFEGCRVCHPTALIRRVVIDKVGKYNYAYRQIQDLDLWIRIAKHYDIHVIPQKLINYRWFLTGAANTSASSIGVLTRGLFEFFLVTESFNNDVSDSLFLEAFHEDMFNKKAATHIEIACERALIMYHKSYLGNTGRIIGMKMMGELLNNSDSRLALESNYYITTKTLAEWTSYPVFYDSVYQTQYMLSNEVTLKDLIKKWIKPYPKLFSFLKWCTQLFRNRN